MNRRYFAAFRSSILLVALLCMMLTLLGPLWAVGGDTVDIVLPGMGSSFTQGDSPVVLDATATVQVTGTVSFDGDTLTVSYASGSDPLDQLSFTSDGAIGAISRVSNFLKYNFGAGPVTIATITGGTNGSTMTVTFNALGDDVTIVQKAVRALTFENTSLNPDETQRVLNIKITGNSAVIMDTDQTTVDVSNSNDAPDAIDDTARTAVNQMVVIDVLDNDTDPDNDTLTIDSFGQGTFGTVVENAGMLEYTPNLDVIGVDTFTYTTRDPSTATDTATVTVTVVNITVNKTTLLVSEGGSSDGYSISLSAQPTADVDITVTANNSQVDLGVGAGVAVMLTFTDQDWNMLQPIFASLDEDDIAEGLVMSTISHVVSSVDTAYDGITIENVTATLNDNDTASVIVTLNGTDTQVIESSMGPPDSPLAFEFPTSDTYTIRLESEPTSVLTLTLNGGSQLTVSPSQLMFDNLNWEDDQQVTVQAIDDNVVEGFHTGTVTHVAGSGDPMYNGIAVDDVVVNIEDNELLADAGDDFEACPGVVTLDGSQSSSTDQSPLTFSWQQTDGPAVTLSDSAAEQPSFTSIVADNYTFLLTVSISGGRQDSNEVIVTVQDKAPIAVVSGDFVMDLNDLPVQLSGLLSFDSNDTSIDQYDWDLCGSNPAADIGDVLNNPSSATPLFTPTAAGLYTLGLLVRSGNEWSEVEKLVISVTDLDVEDLPNSIVAPVADAGQDQDAETGSVVTLFATESIDPDSGAMHTGLEFNWVQTGGPAIVLSDNEAEMPTFTAAQAGLYCFEVFVNDFQDDGFDSDVDEVKVFVFGSGNVPPMAVPEFLSFDDVDVNSALNENESFMLTGVNSTDIEEQALTYAWAQTGGPVYAIDNATSQAMTFIPYVAGSYVFELTVNDGAQDSTPTSITVLVRSDGSTGSDPVAVAQFDDDSTLRRVSAPQPLAVTLDGSMSTGDNGTDASGLSFQWQQIAGPTSLLSQADQSIASVTVFESRVHVFRLTVTNLQGHQRYADVVLAVETFDSDLNPGGNALPDVVVKIKGTPVFGEVVLIDARSSKDSSQDSDGETKPLRFFITQTCGPRVFLQEVELGLWSFVYTVADPDTHANVTFCFDIRADDGNDLSEAFGIETEISNAAPAAALVFGGGGGGGALDLWMLALLVFMMAMMLRRKR